jgi:hypothetical protein
MIPVCFIDQNQICLTKNSFSIVKLFTQTINLISSNDIALAFKEAISLKNLKICYFYSKLTEKSSHDT